MIACWRLSVSEFGEGTTDRRGLNEFVIAVANKETADIHGYPDTVGVVAMLCVVGWHGCCADRVNVAVYVVSSTRAFRECGGYFTKGSY